MEKLHKWHDTMAREKRTFFSSWSEPQNNNFLKLKIPQSETEVSFSQHSFCHFYMSGNNWENTNQKFGFVLKIVKHTETHIEHHFPAGWWVLCIVTAFFWSSVVERGLKDEFQSAYLVPEMEVGWNVGSEVQESDPEKNAARVCHMQQTLMLQKHLPFQPQMLSRDLCLCPAPALTPWFPGDKGPCVHPPAEPCQCHGASSEHWVHPKNSLCGDVQHPACGMRCSSASSRALVLRVLL